MQINSSKLLTMVHEYYTQLLTRGFQLDEHWPIINAWICSKVYIDLINPNHEPSRDSFWALENPEDVEIIIRDRRSAYTVSIKQIADSFVMALSSQELNTNSKPIKHYFEQEFFSRAHGLPIQESSSQQEQTSSYGYY